MPNAFNFSASPFDSLTQHEQRLVRDHVDVVYFRADEVVLDVGAVPAHLFVVIKGYVNQLDADELTTTYGPDDCFDGRGLVAMTTITVPELGKYPEKIGSTINLPVRAWAPGGAQVGFVYEEQGAAT